MWYDMIIIQYYIHIKTVVLNVLFVILLLGFSLVLDLKGRLGSLVEKVGMLVRNLRYRILG